MKIVPLHTSLLWCNEFKITQRIKSGIVIIFRIFLHILVSKIFSKTTQLNIDTDTDIMSLTLKLCAKRLTLFQGVKVVHISLAATVAENFALAPYHIEVPSINVALTSPNVFGEPTGHF